jgi:hypothetical protein
VSVDPVTGNVVAAGQEQTTSGSFEGLVARLTAAGALDTSFDSTGYAVTFAPPLSSTTSLTDFDAVAVEPSGAPNASDIVAGGYSILNGSQTATVAAFGNGGFDSGFGTGGVDLPGAISMVNGVAVLPNGNVVAVGPSSSSSTASALVQYQPNGAPDNAFGGGAVTMPQISGTTLQMTAVAYDPFSGYLSVAGTATTGQPPTATTVLGQYRSDTGTPNSKFGSGGLVQGPSGEFPAPGFPVGVAVQSDGRVVVAGEFPLVNGVEGIGLIRVLGPILSVFNPATVQVGPPDAPVTRGFPVSITEPLVNTVCPILTATGGSLIPFGTCAPGATIAAGLMSITVSVTVNLINIAPNAYQSVQLMVKTGNGLLASTTNTTGTGLIQHLFQQLPGGATDLSVGADGVAWIIGALPTGGGYGIYRWTGFGWAQYPGGAVHIAVDPAGNPWVINSAHQIYHWNGAGWTPYGGLANAISVGADGVVWILGTNPVPGGFAIYRWNGFGWAPYGGGGVGIAVDPAGNPWLINVYHSIYHWTGFGWLLYPGAAVAIAVNRLLWVLGTNPVAGGFAMYQWTGSGWTNPPGGAVRITVAPSGHPWVLTSTHQIFYS